MFKTETYRIVSIGGLRSYRLRTGDFASVSACLDYISAKRFLPDQEHLDRGTVLHDWATASLNGESFDPPDGYGPDEYELYIAPVLNFFESPGARLISANAVHKSLHYRIAGRPDITCVLASDYWIIDLKFCERLIERYDFQLHGYRAMDGLHGYRMGLLQVNRAGKRHFAEVPYDSNKSALIHSAANILRWQMNRAGRDLIDREP